MCGNMVVIQSATAQNRREKKKIEIRNHSGKIECLHVLCRAAIKKSYSLQTFCALTTELSNKSQMQLTFSSSYFYAPEAYDNSVLAQMAG